MASSKAKRNGITWGTPKHIQEEHKLKKHGSLDNRYRPKKKWKCKKGKSNKHDWYFHGFQISSFGNSYWSNWLNFRCSVCNKHDYEIFPIGMWVSIVLRLISNEEYHF